MAELFMECEEEELEPWQKRVREVEEDDEDDDDDEPIFVGEISSSKPATSYILNRVNLSSSRRGIQNGAPSRGTVTTFKSESQQYGTPASSPGAMSAPSVFQTVPRPVTSSVAVQPLTVAVNVSGTSQTLQRPVGGGLSAQQMPGSSSGITQPVSRSVTTQPVSRNITIPVVAQAISRTETTATAQPVILNQDYIMDSPPAAPDNTSGILFGVRQNSGVPQYQTGPAVNVTGTNAASIKNGGPFPRACPKCNIHFNLMDPLKNHMKYCCPDMINNFFPGVVKTECLSTTSKTIESEKGKLIMLVNDFYYGKDEGDLQQVQQEQKTHTTFKCISCLKVLKNNIRFMNHMKHHLELEKQSNESWESHTTCQHCYRQFPTPFQLQCHIESTHTPYESSTICKICELSFDTEQVLLQHMKDNHKPGEMPYVCQVCSYRSSAFSDVETHFRTVHENTKHLLCPFCLKVIKIGAPYMHHYMRHQKKGIYRCTKCRLQFLTCKEKMDHKTQHHRTFRKPKQLEGLPPGTKVTIRASLGSHQSGSSATSSVSTSSSTFQLSPKAKNATTKNHNKSNTSKSRGKSKQSTSRKQSAWTNSRKKKEPTNIAFPSLRHRVGTHKCIECFSEVKDFASHFPAYVHCSLCRYSTSCSKAYVNHMMSFHSARPSKRFWIFKKHSEKLRGVTVVCLHCDFLADVSGLDNMATHLSENQTHTCQVIVEKDNATAAQVSHKQDHDSSDETKECSQNQTKEVASTEKSEDSSLSNTENVPSLELPGNSSKNSLHEKRTYCDSANNKQLVDEKQKCINDESEVKMCQSSADIVLNEQTKVRPLDEAALSAKNVRDLKLTLGEDVSFEQFLRKRDEPESVSSDISEQGSIHLEPLTPSEVLEHEATEILQKGNVAPSSKKSGQLAEQTDETSRDSNPSRMETPANKTDENEAS
ncbi:zinc finger protein 280D isoform X1 [Oenanthe melanoleuca]|uniref:zinc finger protein 280D isoform X1 n=1 Tax=Oenanthe melanoleuca TaxID=2939378 RepID=UPI0024C1D5AF|nr:zinc finger protein 280D isoform X1 [Oenanthe melanoleuca]XP_056356072.1 zinc finger protein 280D isoform X1 [Oenanthe melanoleuca]XP_056356073.1 zinc finger protein 280D isoform X1 [Oenanthe melanoleuca]XP_056356074.1 zinc finger protein 280D isoform X1 [Oenanthe melanoleuca]